MARDLEIERVGDDRILEELFEPNQLAALEALLTGGTVVEATYDSGVSRETVPRWLGENEVFRRSYDRIRREAIEALERAVC